MTQIPKIEQIRFDLTKFMSEERIPYKELEIKDLGYLTNAIAIRLTRQIPSFTKTELKNEYAKIVVPKTWVDHILYRFKWLQIFKTPKYARYNEHIHITYNYTICLPNIKELNEAVKIRGKDVNDIVVNYIEPHENKAVEN